MPDETRIHLLATYNSEVAHGVVHTDEWVACMAAEQEWFNKRQRDEMIAQGGEEVSPGVWMVPAPRKRRFWEVLRGV